MSYLDCFNDLEDALSAAEAIHCIQKYGETVLYDDTKKRLILWREQYDKAPEKYMIKISELKNIFESYGFTLKDHRDFEYNYADIYIF